jgi:hypothetical protein
MKTYKLYLFIVLYLLCRISYCDIIPPNSHYVNKCVKITNVNDYPDISLLGVINDVLYDQTTYLIGPTTCLYKGRGSNCLTIYGVNNSYLTGKDIATIDWSKDKHALKTNIQINPDGGYADNSNVIYSVKQYYRIVGFTDNSVVLYKCKEVDYFCNGSIAVSSIGKYRGDSTKLSQSLPAGTKVASDSYGTTINLFPNPVQKSFRLKLTNSYRGNVSVKICTIDGKSIKTFNVYKTELLLDYLIHADYLAKGSYFVNIIMGDAIEIKKIVIE